MLSLSQEAGPVACVAGLFGLPPLAVWRPWSSGSCPAEPQSAGEVRGVLVRPVPRACTLGATEQGRSSGHCPAWLASCRLRCLGAGLCSPRESAAVICDLRSSCMAGEGGNIS